MIKQILPNGLTLVLNPMPHMKSVSMGIFIKCGSAYETKENNGISHFIEHLLFKGTKNRTAKQISEEADELGGSLNAYTSEECICLYLKVLERDGAQALDLLCDIACNPVFDSDAIENEKKVISEEIAGAEDNPEDAAQEMLMAAILPYHPVGMPVLGNEKNVNSFTRGQITEFYNSRFVPGNMVVSISGCFDGVEMEAAVKASALAQAKNEDKPSLNCNDTQISGGLSKECRDIGQLQLVAGYPCVSRHDSRLYSFVVLSGILGGDGSSRLFRRLREENGLVYSVDATVAEYDDVGVFVINTAFSAENADSVRKIISGEINDIMNGNVTEQELERTKRNIIISLELEEEGTMSTMSINGKRTLYGLSEDTGEIEAKYNKITCEDVVNAARCVFGDANKEAVAIVGDCKNIKKYSLIKG